MATLRQVRLRIQGIKNTEKITRAMKIVAATKLRRLDRIQRVSKPYAQTIESLLREIALYPHEDADPLLVPKRKVRRAGFLILSSDRGLCGSFNVNLFKKVRLILEEEEAKGRVPVLYLFGQKACRYFSRLNFAVRYSRMQTVKEERGRIVGDCADKLCEDFLSGEIDSAAILYTEFQSSGNFGFAVKPYLPVRLEGAARASVDFIYEPSYGLLARGVLKLYLTHVMRQAFLESLAAEEASRMLAMDYATENAETIIEELTLFYNRNRQAAITKEISEIVGGAEALARE